MLPDTKLILAVALLSFSSLIRPWIDYPSVCRACNVIRDPHEVVRFLDLTHSPPPGASHSHSSNRFGPSAASSHLIYTQTRSRSSGTLIYYLFLTPAPFGPLVFSFSPTDHTIQPRKARLNAIFDLITARPNTTGIHHTLCSVYVPPPCVPPSSVASSPSSRSAFSVLLYGQPARDARSGEHESCRALGGSLWVHLRLPRFHWRP